MKPFTSLLLWLISGSLIVFGALFFASDLSRQCLRRPFFLVSYGLVPDSATSTAASLLLPTVEIFVAPNPPFHGASASRHRSMSSDTQLLRSVVSWLDSIPSARITLMGRHPSLYNVAAELQRQRRAIHVRVEPNVDHTFRGTPQIHSMLARAFQSDANISILVMDAESTLFSRRFADALYATLLLRRDWVLFSRSGGGVDHDDQHVQFWAWNNQPRMPLLSSAVPPFAHFKGDHRSDSWIASHIIREAHPRIVVDATAARITTSFTVLPTDSSSSSSSVAAGSCNDDWTWESRINLMLSEAAAMTEAPTNSNVQNASSCIDAWELKRCAETPDDEIPESRHSYFCITRTKQKQQQKQQEEEKTSKKGGNRSVGFFVDPDRNNRSETSTMYSEGRTQPISYYYTLDELLPRVADENKVVVMVGGTSNYKEMLMSFVCRVQALGIKSVLVAAFDDAMREFAFLQGLAVYKENSSEQHRSAIGADPFCLFDSDCFKRVSKLKSVSVLRVLRKGYSVLWSDMDIYWARNPLPEMLSYGAGTLVIQSDERDENLPENNVRGANSGFYLARAEEGTVAAMEAIVRHAMGTDMTEQPSFYDVLCGEKGERRVGKRECKWTSSKKSGGGGRRRRRQSVALRTIFLSRRRYPNGFVFRLWESEDTLRSCHSQECVILHNNYIQGKANKMSRFVSRGMWFYDADAAMCLQPWNPLSASRLPLPEFSAHFHRSLRL